MELEFGTEKLGFLNPVAGGWQRQELVQELKLPEGLPDVGRSLGAWGQVILRSKQWHSDEMRVSGGIMVWLHYAPEEGGAVQKLESWVPFQFAWDYPQTQREGSMTVSFLLPGLDVRAVSSRKLMLRATVAAFGQAMEPQSVELPKASELPPEVALLTDTNNFLIPTESGEKGFLLEEDIPLGSGDVLGWQLLPVLEEQKLLGDKLVFRGRVDARLLWQEDGHMENRDYSLPFSQYGELEADYGEAAQPTISLCLTSFEPELQEGNLHIKLSCTAQYLVAAQRSLELPVDAYCPKRESELHRGEWKLPVCSPLPRDTVSVSCPVEGNVTGLQFLSEPPVSLREGEQRIAQLNGNFNLLTGEGENSMLQNRSWQGQLPLGELGDVPLGLEQSGLPKGNMGQVGTELRLNGMAVEQRNVEAISGMSLGEPLTGSEEEPALLICRCKGESLWQLAKANGSTREKIAAANHLTDAPQQGQMLLIPLE